MIDSPLISAIHHRQAAVTPEEQRQQLAKVLGSEVFRNAPALKNFLEYVTYKTMEGLSDEIKEYAIGTDVFGKTGEYDPKLDTTVRVQANRLREKLKRYYEGEGSADSIVLAIPKGHYIASFSRRPATGGGEDWPAPPSTAQTAQPVGSWVNSARRQISSLTSLLRRYPAIGLTIGFVGVALVLGALVLFPRLNRSVGGSGPAGRDTALAASIADPISALWSEFMKVGSSPMVGYSNSIFLATENSDLLRVDSEDVDNVGAPARNDVARRLSANPRLLDRAGPVFFEDLYTGTGEVMAVFYITRLFTEAHSPLGVKRGRLVTISDLSQHDMIFLGSTVENNLLAKLPLTEEFVFSLPPNAPHLWGCRIQNLNPRPGEGRFYETERDPKTEVLRADYALVSFLPGLTPARRIAVLGGLTTIGTEAAAEYATSQAGIAELLAHLGAGTSGARSLPRFFQAVLRVEIMKGDVLRIGYVAGHTIQPGQPRD